MKPISQSQIHRKFFALQNRLFFKMIPSYQGLPNWENLPTKKREKITTNTSTHDSMAYTACTVRTCGCAVDSTRTHTLSILFDTYPRPVHPVRCIPMPYRFYTVCTNCTCCMCELPRFVLAIKSVFCYPLALFSFRLSKKVLLFLSL
jgi:hypothetical protein